MCGGADPETPETDGHSSRFYARSEEESGQLAEAAKLRDLEAEIPMLRLRLREAVNAENVDLRQVQRVMSVLVRAVVAQHKLSPRQTGQLERELEALAAHFREDFGFSKVAMGDER